MAPPIDQTCFWAPFATYVTLLMTSGQMWNQIKGPPLLGHDQEHDIYIYPGNNGQFILETYLVMILNAGVSIGFAMMTASLDGSRGSYIKERKNIVRLGSAISVLFFSSLLNIFNTKIYGYPYKLLF